MGITLNPLLFSGLQKVTKPAGDTFYGDSVNTATELPTSSVDGEIRVVKDENALYMFDAPTSSWIKLTDPTTDIKMLSYVGTETSTFSDIPGLKFAPEVNGFSALVEVEKNTEKEIFTIIATKTSAGVDKYTQAVGDITSVEFDIVLTGSNELKAQYKTNAIPATYNITFRAITLT